MLLSTILLQAAGAAVWSKVAGALGAAVAALAAAWGIGKIGQSAMEAIARQPESAGGIRTAMLIIGALVEGACLFAIIACLMAIVLK
ncbi:MAG: ATP synthase F0 subunit C [Bacteroidales bacterium]|nr:ATP synthase F0 subunit C [Bacteroidales bacterium]MBQ6689368.1 ATP synthase F0 subunit C [Bacteroidales bacterium]